MKATTFLILLFTGSWIHAQQFTWTELPDHTYPDSLHWPFILGVASSEPDTDAIYIWTYAEPDSFTQANRSINWKLSADSNFNLLMDSGTVTIDSNTSWTTTLHVDGLTPDNYYWYRFDDGRGNYSVRGRTRTLPVNNDNIKLVVGSCSSLFTGYYNAYARIAELDDITAVIHLGDWAYDNNNRNRLVRETVPDFANIACGMEERRKRDYLYLLDPDLRAVRQKHPFIYIWDNHDIQKGLADSLQNNCRAAFREWTPMPLFDPNDPARIYRKISMGPLVDLFMIDVQYTKEDRDTIAPGEESYLGIEQFNWLINGLQNSTAKWKLIGNQKLFGEFSVKGLEGLVPDGVGGDDKSWDSHQLERERLLTFIDTNNIDNVVILSGDAHFLVVSDLPINPFDSLAYNGKTGEGSVAVELLPSAFSSPNIDERGIMFTLDDLLVDISLGLNPHQFFMEFMENGYAVLDLKPDSLLADVWLMDVKKITMEQHLATELVLRNGVNHWKREPVSTNITEPAKKEIGNFKIFPNPTNESVNLLWNSMESTRARIEVINAKGKKVIRKSLVSRHGANQIMLDLGELSTGIYLIKLSMANSYVTQRVVKE